MIVDLNLSDEQQLIIDSLGSLLADRLPVARLRDQASRGGAAERAAWAELAGFGLFGMALEAQEGGLGLGLAEQVLCAQTLGGHLASPGVLAQMIAPHLAQDSDRRAALADGSIRAAFLNRIDRDHSHILDGGGAEVWVALADGVALYPADGDAVPLALVDETVSAGRLSRRIDFIASDEHGDRLSLLLAAYLVGIAVATRDAAVAHARQREQFGQPIGAFQAIKHQCADMAVRAAAAEAQVRYAAVSFGRGDDDRAEAAAAWLLATRAALANATACIQIHGAMGFTAECDVHMFLKRAHVVATLGSDRVTEDRRALVSAC